MIRHTPFADLDEVLERLLGGVRGTLGEAFVGLYLQGSFALGDADRWSDVDFVVATDGELDDGRRDRLQSLHGALFRLPSPWAQHLEGSYVPRALLRRRADPQRSFPYVDNGSTDVVLDPHDDTHVVRWILREHGIALAGPPAQELVDPVTAADLRNEMVGTMAVYAEWAPEPSPVGRMSRWKQTYLVTTVCRILATVAWGRVPTKPKALAWAYDTLPSEWRALVQRASDDRPDPWARVHQPAEDVLVDATRAFVTWATHDVWARMPRT